MNILFTIGRKVVTTIIFLSYLFVVVLILLEISVRICGYSTRYLYDPIYMPFEKYEDIPYIIKPNLVNALGQGHAIINTDSLGLRSKISGLRYGAKSKNEYRIAIAGDSITFGVGIKETKDTYCEVLNDILNNKQNKLKVRVLNYGVSGYSVKNMLDTLQFRILNMDPDLIIMAFIPDDFDLKRTGHIDKFGYKINERLSGFMPKNSIIKLLLRRSHLAYLIRNIRYKLINRDRKRGEYNNISGESFRYILKFTDIAEKNKIQYLILLLPDENLMFSKILADQFNKRNINYLDLSSIYYDYSSDIYKSSKYDSHPSAAVHRRIAEEIAKYILTSLL